MLSPLCPHPSGAGDPQNPEHTIQVQEACNSPVTIVRAGQWQEHVSGATVVASAVVIIVVTARIVCGPCGGLGVLGRCGCPCSLSLLPGGCGGDLWG